MRRLVFVTIPFVLAVPPVLGWLIGNWLDEKLNTKPFLMYILIVLGFCAGFREMFRILKRFGNDT
jgi:ATP synthase protein I